MQRRNDEKRRKGEGDVEGGYVSYTGVHYAAGAAASKEANYKPEDDGTFGPALMPGARPSMPSSEKRDEGEAAAGGGAAGPTQAGGGAAAATGGGSSAKTGVGLSIRDKLKRKKPSFM